MRLRRRPWAGPEYANIIGRPATHGELLGAPEVETTVPIIFGIESLSCGYDFGDAVTEDYPHAVPLHGHDQERDDLSGELIQGDEAQMQMMAQ